MSDIFKPSQSGTTSSTSGSTGSTSPDNSSYTSSPGAGAGYPRPGDSTYAGADSPESYESGSSGEAGKTLLAGVVGGIASAVGYIVYSRLPDQQKERLQQQARSLIESRINDLRSRFNI